ncbi:hypothetical protein BUE93_09140 [Chromobacterium amazonense]|uniref:Effector protein BipC n=1 Tax=Chromobacterium amazonense TaxID=1382803 RepID=A0A2S9X5M0_9NEIS|nr:IpaC/SipC family type III secretion system effector [Chromobacterium amazonense]PRP70977.1 hypothetical protein BUE93_09140 [Chromobacterium amazonense]
MITIANSPFPQFRPIDSFHVSQKPINDACIPASNYFNSDIEYGAIGPGSRPQAPALTPPPVAAPDKAASRAWVQEALQDHEFGEDTVKKLMLIKEKASCPPENVTDVGQESGSQERLSIKGLAHRSAALLDVLSDLMLILMEANVRTVQHNMMMAYESALMKRDAGYREATDILSGAATGAATSIGMAGMGTYMSLKGAGIKGDALKHNKSQIDTLNAEKRALRGTLDSQGTVKLDMDQADTLTHLKPKATGATQELNQAGMPGGNTHVVDGMGEPAVPLQSSNKQLDKQQKAVLSRPIDEIESELDAQHNALQANNLKGSRLEAKGQAVSGAAFALSSITRSTSDYSAAVERADQGLLQTDEQVSSSAEQAAREAENAMRSDFQEMLRNIFSLMTNSADTNSAMAANRMA